MLVLSPYTLCIIKIRVSDRTL